MKYLRFLLVASLVSFTLWNSLQTRTVKHDVQTIKNSQVLGFNAIQAQNYFPSTNSTSSAATTSNFIGTILPASNNAYDLGSATRQWRNLYLANALTATSATFVSMTSTNGNFTNLTATNITSTQVTSTNITITTQRFTNAASTIFLNSDSAGWLFNGGYVFAAGPGSSLYVANGAVFRGALSNDTLATLTVNGGTSGITNFVSKVGINSTTPIATLGIKGVAGTTPVDITSSTGAHLVRVFQDGQIVFGPNTLAQTGAQVVSHSTANPIALSFTDDTNYTAFLGRPAGTSAQMVVGGQTGTSFNAAANGTVYLSILNTGLAGFNSSTPNSSLSVKSIAGAIPFTVASSSNANLFTIIQNGNVGINSSSPNYILAVSGTVAFSNLRTNITGDGICRTTAGEITDAGAAACIPSALKYKTNVTPYTKSATKLFTDLFNAGAVSNYELKSKLGDPRKGLIADVVEKVDPDLVGYSADGSVNTLHFEDVTGLSVQAIAELNARITMLENEIKKLKEKK